MTSTHAAAQNLRDLARLRRVRDRIDREYAQPLNVDALAQGAHMSAGHLSRQFRAAYGESPYARRNSRLRCPADMCAPRASASTSSGRAYSRSIRSRTRRSRARSRRCSSAAGLVVT